MDEISKTGEVKKTPRRRWWLWLLGGVIFAGLAIAVAGYAKYKYLRAHADQILRDRLVASLSALYHSPVTLDSLHLDVGANIHVTGTGLKILYVAGPDRPDADPTNPPPMVSLDRFDFETNFKDLFQPTTRIVAVYVKGLQLHIPPHGPGHIPHVRDPHEQKNPPKVSLLVDKIVCTDSQLVIETTKPGKLPLVFNIANITLKDVGTNKPFVYDANLTNPRPVGTVHATGHFGPWQADDPRETALDGDYTFTNADLGPFKGIAGILSSTGKFYGKLGHINVDGETDTPDFRLDISDHPVPLHTDFKAVVNGTTGDTTLNEVVARLQKTIIHASGSVVRVGDPRTGVTGHDTELTVAIDQGRIEDLLTLATKTSPPVIAGFVSVRQKLSIPPGKETVAKRMRLGGTFTVKQATFGTPSMQQKIDEMSMRAQGRPKAANAQDATLVLSTMTGEFQQAKGVLDFSDLQYAMPGAVIKMKGQYKLVGNSFDFKGIVRTDATASQMTTGWKSMLLKAVDPLLKKNGAGLEVPITVSGTKAAPKFGVDMNRLFK
jgi:hypothetical protein